MYIDVMRDHFQRKIKEGSQITLEDSVRKHLHTTISSRTFETLKKLAEVYGTITNVLEEAIKLLQVKARMMDNLKKDELDESELWQLMRSDFNMLVVGRRTFLSYIENLPKAPMHDNNAIELIEWYHDTTSFKDLTLPDILEAIRRVWIAGNYFRSIEIEEIVPLMKYEIIFNHDFSDKAYGQYWAEYFTTLFMLPQLNCSVETQIRNQRFYLTINRNH